MRKVITTLAVMVSLFVFGLASAGSVLAIAVDDRAVDYTNTDLEEAYLSLGQDGDSLLLTLSDTPFDNRLPPIAITIPDLGKEDFWGNAIGAELQDIEEITLHPYGWRYRGIEVVHPLANLRQVETSYLEVLAQLGFRMTETVLDTANIRGHLFTRGEATLRMVFTHQGAEVTVGIFN